MSNGHYPSLSAYHQPADMQLFSNIFKQFFRLKIRKSIICRLSSEMFWQISFGEPNFCASSIHTSKHARALHGSEFKSIEHLYTYGAKIG
jgi:hypothetical protein